MKNKIFIIPLLFILSFSLYSCNNNKKQKLSIVTTIFPIYDWVSEIINSSESFDLYLLQNKNIDIHSYNPTFSDIVKIHESDLFIYVGGESDDWVSDVLATNNNDNHQTINLINALGEYAKLEETIEGIETSEEELEFDEHIWLSLRNAKYLVEQITNSIISLDSINRQLYEENKNQYINKLNDLDNLYISEIDKMTNKTLLFGDRFPFRYLVDDYNLKYYAAFSGCSSEADASFSTILFLSNKIDELHLHTILVLENSKLDTANAIKNNTNDKNQKILKIHSLQSNIDNSQTYLSIMQDNLNIIIEALK